MRRAGPAPFFFVTRLLVGAMQPAQRLAEVRAGEDLDRLPTPTRLAWRLVAREFAENGVGGADGAGARQRGEDPLAAVVADHPKHRLGGHLRPGHEFALEECQRRL